MDIKELEVVDVMGAKTGKAVKVDLDNSQIRSYSNKNNEAIYSTVDIDNGQEVDVIVNKRVDEIEERLSTWNNPVKFVYAVNLIDFDQTKNDPELQIWHKVVNYVSAHQSDFFTKDGDWKKRVRANTKKMNLELVND